MRDKSMEAELSMRVNKGIGEWDLLSKLETAVVNQLNAT